MIINEPEEQRRVKTIAEIAYSIKNYSGNLNLKCSREEIRLFGLNKTFYHTKTFFENGSPRKFSKDEITQKVSDVTCAVEREN